MPDNQSTDKHQEKTLATPVKTEEAVHSAVSEVVPDGLLIEEDGDPFWVIQKVFWGILKTVALLGLLLFLIWLVWRPGAFLGGNETNDNFEIEPEPVVVEVPTEEPTEGKPGFWARLFKKDNPPQITNTVPADTQKKTAPPDNVSTLNLPAPTVKTEETGTQIAYQLEEDRTLLVRGIIGQSVQWLREAKTVGEISMSLLRQGSPANRAAQVEEILAAADDLFVRSANLQTQLKSETDYFLQAGEAANLRTAELEAQIAQRLEALDPIPLEGLLAEKILSQQNASYYMSNAKIRDTLLKNMQTFDRLLKQRSIPLLDPATEIRAS